MPVYYYILFFSVLYYMILYYFTLYLIPLYFIIFYYIILYYMLYHITYDLHNQLHQLRTGWLVDDRDDRDATRSPGGLLVVSSIKLGKIISFIWIQYGLHMDL